MNPSDHISEWRVVLVDNFNREHISDVLFAVCPSEGAAHRICTALCANCSDSSRAWYEVYPPNKDLYTFQP
jgi:hypothetical protein